MPRKPGWELRRSRHGRHREYCPFYLRHWHLGPWILWSPWPPGAR